MKRLVSTLSMTVLLCSLASAETFRTVIAGKIDLGAKTPDGSELELSYVDSTVIALSGDTRFLRGIELELKAPAAFLKYRGSLAIAFYTPLAAAIPSTGIADISAERIAFELLPNKLQTVYQIPLRKNHGLKSSPYASIPTGVLAPSSFPLLVRIMPVVKGLAEEIETMRFTLHVKPLYAQEGAVKLHLRYPDKLRDKPLTLRIDDQVIDSPAREIVLSEGEHHLAILSEDYRNESRQFVVERSQVTDLTIELQDPTPLVIIEAPENAKVSFDGQPVATPRQPFPADPGEHELHFTIGDYSITKPLVLRKGYSYRVNLAIDVLVQESD